MPHVKGKIMAYAPTLGLWTPGTFEWIVIAVVLLLLFGKRLPDVARSIGKSLTEFKKGMHDGLKV